MLNKHSLGPLKKGVAKQSRIKKDYLALKMAGKNKGWYHSAANRISKTKNWYQVATKSIGKNKNWYLVVAN